MSDLCEQCKVEYTKVKSWQKFCSKKCKDTNFFIRNPEARKIYNKKQELTPTTKYHVQKQGAKRRGIGFTLSFEEWWGLWEPFWDQRGKGKEALVMSRVGDLGNYELGNVYINTYSNNSRDACLNKPQKKDIVTGRFI
jgi:hypothetical protein